MCREFDRGRLAQLVLYLCAHDPLRTCGCGMTNGRVDDRVSVICPCMLCCPEMSRDRPCVGRSLPSQTRSLGRNSVANSVAWSQSDRVATLRHSGKGATTAGPQRKIAVGNGELLGVSVHVLQPAFTSGVLSVLCLSWSWQTSLRDATRRLLRSTSWCAAPYSASNQVLDAELRILLRRSRKREAKWHRSWPACRLVR